MIFKNNCTQQLQVRENVVEFDKALGAVKVIKDQIQYRSQSLLNLARGYFIISFLTCTQSGTPIEISLCYFNNFKGTSQFHSV